MKEFCVDLELAKELKENGFPQRSQFKWCEDEENYPESWVAYDTSAMGCTKDIVCSAPCSDEILKELPDQTDGYLQILTDELWEVGYADHGEFTYIEGNFYEKDQKLSNALAKLWLYLKKEGYIK